MNIRGEFSGVVTGLAVVGSFLLVAVSVNFAIPGQALLQTLRFHLAGVLLVAVVALLLAGSWRRGLLFALVAAMSLAEGGWFVHRMQAMRAEAGAAPREPLMRVLSFNILNSNMANGAAIADYVRQSGADVVLVMEAAPLAPHLGALASVYPGRFGCSEQRNCDLMVLSKTPLRGARFHDLGSTWRNRLITARTQIAGQSVNIVAVHMVKPYFDSASVAEARRLRRIIDEIEGPMVLGGDFNAAPWSDNIEWLVRNGRLIGGPRYPATWPVPLGPLGVPIDNLFTRDGLFIETLVATPPLGSNHRGLRAEIGLSR